MPRLFRRAPAAVRRCTVLALILFFATLASAQVALYQPGSPIYLWKISNGKNAAYLLGSMHVAMPSFYPLPQEMDRAFAASNVLVVEVDMTKVDMAKLQQLTMELGTYPPEDDLIRHLKPETVEKVKQFCTQAKLPYEGVSHLRPWMLSLLVTQFNMNQSGYDAKYGIDLHYLQTPGEHRVDELETAEEQLRLIAAPTGDDEETSLAHLFDYADRQKEITARMVDAWAHGESDKIDTLVNELLQEATPGERKQMHRLNAERNPKMAAHLEQCLAANDRCLMIVGALHVAGKEGILSLLQAKGYKIEQLTMDTQKEGVRVRLQAEPK